MFTNFIEYFMALPDNTIKDSFPLENIQVYKLLQVLKRRLN